MRFALYSTVLVLLVACGPAAAHGKTDLQTRVEFEAYAQCVVDKYPTEAAEAVLTESNDKALIKSYAKLITPDCLKVDDVTLSMPGGDFLRYGLAQALVRNEYAAGLPTDISAAGPIAHFELDETNYQPKPGKPAKPQDLANLKERRAHDAAIEVMSYYGECVARADPSLALKLVLSRSGSAVESQTLTAMGNSLSSCLPKGQTITLDKTSLRGTVAMNLYRLAHAPRTQGATSQR